MPAFARLIAPCTLHAARCTLYAASCTLYAANCTLAAQVPAELRGRVTDGATGRAIGHAHVQLGPALVTAATDGEYVVRGLDPGTYTVHVRAIGYAAARFEAQLANGRVTRGDVALYAISLTLPSVEVVAAARGPAGGAITFDRERIERSGGRDIADVIASVPGVVVTRSGGPGAPAHVSIRGSSASQVLVLLDGVVLNAAGNGEADLSRVSMENAERITIHTGAQSARFGPRALAGVIEIETRRGARDIAATMRGGAWGERAAAITAGVPVARGAFPVTASASADYRAINGDFEYDVPAFRGGGRTRRFNSDVEAREASLRLSGGSDATGLAVAASWRGLERGMPGTIAQPSHTGRQEHDRTGITAEAWRNGRFQLVARTDVTREESTLRDAAPPFGAPYSDTLEITGLTASVAAATRAGRVDFGTGLELRTLDADASYFGASPPSQRFVAWWLEARRSWDAAALTVNASATGRIDYLHHEERAFASPRVSGGVARGKFSLDASFATAFAPPTLADQFFREGVQVRANPDLRSERTTADVEVRGALRELSVASVVFRFDAAIYRADVRDMILWQPDFRFIWSPRNFNVRRSGAEASASAAIGEHVDIAGSVSHAKTEYAGGVLSGQVAYRPRHTANIAVGASLGRVRTDITARHIGTRRTVAGSPINALDPYWTADLRVSGRLHQSGWRFEPTFGVENLFDTNASMLSDYPFAGRSWSTAVRISRQ